MLPLKDPSTFFSGSTGATLLTRFLLTFLGCRRGALRARCPPERVKRAKAATSVLAEEGPGLYVEEKEIVPAAPPLLQSNWVTRCDSTVGVYLVRLFHIDDL